MDAFFGRALEAHTGRPPSGKTVSGLRLPGVVWVRGERARRVVVSDGARCTADYVSAALAAYHEGDPEEALCGKGAEHRLYDARGNRVRQQRSVVVLAGGRPCELVLGTSRIPTAGTLLLAHDHAPWLDPLDPPIGTRAQLRLDAGPDASGLRGHVRGTTHALHTAYAASPVQLGSRRSLAWLARERVDLVGYAGGQQCKLIVPRPGSLSAPGGTAPPTGVAGVLGAAVDRSVARLRTIFGASAPQVRRLLELSDDALETLSRYEELADKFAPLFALLRRELARTAWHRTHREDRFWGTESRGRAALQPTLAEEIRRRRELESESFESSLAALRARALAPPRSLASYLREKKRAGGAPALRASEWRVVSRDARTLHLRLLETRVLAEEPPPRLKLSEFVDKLFGLF